MLYTSEYFINKLQEFKGNKNYIDNKNAIRDIAIEYSLSYGKNIVYYMSEICVIEDLLLKYGKRYGLLKEFKENGIC